MRNTIVLLFLILHTVSYGQSFKGYVFLGASTSQVAGDALSGFNKAGIDVGGGVFTVITRNHKSMIGMEIGYIQKGSRRPTNVDSGDFSTYILRLNYIEIPLYYKYVITSRFHVYAGGSVGVLTSSYEERDGNVFIRRSKALYNDVVLFNKFDLSVIGGMEYIFSEEWRLNFRGMQSITPARDFGGRIPYTAYHNGQYNNVLAFTINYIFKTKRINGKEEE